MPWKTNLFYIKKIRQLKHNNSIIKNSIKYSLINSLIKYKTEEILQYIRGLPWT